jgi:hypothetical protein
MRGILKPLHLPRDKSSAILRGLYEYAIPIFCLPITGAAFATNRKLLSILFFLFGIIPFFIKVE